MHASVDRQIEDDRQIDYIYVYIYMCIHIHVYIVASIFSFRRKSDISYLEERERKKKREVLCTHDICRITYLYTEKHASHRNKIRCSLQDSYDL